MKKIVNEATAFQAGKQEGQNVPNSDKAYELARNEDLYKFANIDEPLPPYMERFVAKVQGRIAGLKGE